MNHRLAYRRSATRVKRLAEPGLKAGFAAHFMWSKYSSDGVMRDMVLDRMADAGMTVCRFDVGWINHETSKGVWSSYYDNKLTGVVDAMVARGITPCVMFWMTPGWAGGTEAGGYREAPANSQDYADAIGRMVSVYGDRVKYWEIWNEQDSSSFYIGSLSQYVDMLGKAYTSVKAARSDCRVLLGGTQYTGGQPTGGVPWIQAAYQASPGIAGKFDILTTHPYMAPGDIDPYSLDDGTVNRVARHDWVRSLMATHGDSDKPIWWTELGWSVRANDGTEPNWQRGVSDKTQANYAVKMYELALSKPEWKVEAYCWYNELEKITDDMHQAGYGLIRKDSPNASRLALDALKTRITTGIYAPYPAAPFTYDFTGGSGSLFDSSKFITSNTNATTDIQNNEGRFAVAAGSSGNRARVIAQMDPMKDSELVCSYRWQDSSPTASRSYVRFWLRGTGIWTSTASPLDGYGIEIQSDSATLAGQKVVNSTAAVLGTAASGLVAGTTKRWLRLRVAGETMQARVWVDGNTEPTDWQSSFSGLNEVVSEGFLQVSVRVSSSATANNAIYLDDISVVQL